MTALARTAPITVAQAKPAEEVVTEVIQTYGAPKSEGPGLPPPGPSPDVEEPDDRGALEPGSGPLLSEPHPGVVGSAGGLIASASGSSATDEPEEPCCDYRDHGDGSCACPDHPPSEFHPYGCLGPDPKKGQGDEGAEVEGDGGQPRQEATDGPVGQDHGDSASEPSPAVSKGPGGVAGVAAVAVPAPPSPFTVRLAIEFLLETPDFEVAATVDDLRMLAAWCNRNLALQGHEDPHEECRKRMGHLQDLLDRARAA